MCRSHRSVATGMYNHASLPTHIPGPEQTQQACPNCLNCNHQPYGGVNPMMGHHPHYIPGVRAARDPFERLPIVGLGVMCGKWAYKSYKTSKAKKQAKEASQRGVVPAIRDPSNEVLDAAYSHGDPTSEKGAIRSTSTKHRASGSSTDSSVSSADVQDLLDRDPEFREYMERQRQIYLNQRDGRDGPIVASDSASQDFPPTYDAVVAQNHVRTDQPAPANENENLSSPVISELRGSEIREADGSPVTPLVPSEGTMNETSALASQNFGKPIYGVELPAVGA